MSFAAREQLPQALNAAPNKPYIHSRQGGTPVFAGIHRTPARPRGQSNTGKYIIGRHGTLRPTRTVNFARVRARGS